ncbi:MAG: subtilase-type protease inhibitor [Actinomycetota bacterium]|nr:subtilase-type protease inhibitor [Actinomycetota bacterium]
MVAGGCGDSGGAGSDDDFGESDSMLEVTLDSDGADGKAEATTRKVSCPDGAGDAACEAVAALDVDALAPTPADVACTEIYGGPDTASLQGTIRGERVDVELTRANGCEIARFDAAMPLLKALFPGYEPGASLVP